MINRTIILLRLSVANLTAKPFGNLLSILLFAIGIAIISLLMRFEEQAAQQYRRNIAGIDLVAGAKGSPLQLILSAVMHADVPTGNISLAEARLIGNHPLIERSIPLALGDNYLGFRIVGTEPAYAALYHAELNEGSWWNKPMEVVLGAEASKITKLKTGDSFTGVHGFLDIGHEHDEHPYFVAGVLQTTGSVLDRLILTSVESVWEVHGYHVHDENCDHDYDHDHPHAIGHDAPFSDDPHDELLSQEEFDLLGLEEGWLAPATENGPEITALLLFYRNPAAAISIPRLINANTRMQAASPANELNRLQSMLGYGFDALRLLAWMIIFISALSMLMQLLASLHQNMNEIALLRALGASAKGVLLVLVTQGILLGLTGWIAGMFLVRLVANMVTGPVALLLDYPLTPLENEFLLLGLSLIIGLLAAFPPAFRAYRSNVHQILSR